MRTPTPSAASLYFDPIADQEFSANRIIEELQRRRIPAVVLDADHPDGPLARVAVDERGDLIVVSTDGSMVTTDAAAVITSLAAAWGVGLVLEAEHVFHAADFGGDAIDGPVAEEHDRSGATVVYVVGGAVPIDPARRLEIAAQLESSVTIVPADDTHLVVPHGEVRDYWLPAQRPVVAVRHDAGSLVVDIFSTSGLRTTGPVRERMAMRALPDVRLHWHTGWLPVLAGDGEIAAVQRLLARGTVSGGLFSGDERDIEPALGELGTSRAVIDDVLDRSDDPELVPTVVAALRVPTVVGSLVERSVHVEALPGAQRVERTGIGRMVWEQTIAPPRGSSWWARWRRMPHRHPRLSAVLTLIEALATIAMVSLLLTAPPTGPWDVVLWVVASVLAIDVVSDVVLLVALVKRRRRFT